MANTNQAGVKRVERPLSPHLQIYRPQLTSFTSILTRITGNGLVEHVGHQGQAGLLAEGPAQLGVEVLAFGLAQVAQAKAR